MLFLASIPRIQSLIYNQIKTVINEWREELKNPQGERLPNSEWLDSFHDKKTDIETNVTARRAPRYVGGAFSMRWFTFIGEFNSRVGKYDTY